MQLGVVAVVALPQRPSAQGKHAVVVAPPGLKVPARHGVRVADVVPEGQP